MDQLREKYGSSIISYNTHGPQIVTIKPLLRLLQIKPHLSIFHINKPIKSVYKLSTCNDIKSKSSQCKDINKMCEDCKRINITSETYRILKCQGLL